MSLKPIRYPLDKTGKSPDNLVLNETRTLKPTKVRCFATSNGGFFTESMVIRDTKTGKVLTKDQYGFDNLFDMATKDCGKEVAGIVVITDKSVSNTISYDYQCIGGLYGYSVEAIIQQIEALKLDNRPVEWGNIFNKPSIYPPAKHLHDIGDVYGFEYLVHAIEQLRQAILIGDEGAHNVIYEYIDALGNSLTILINNLRDDLDAHAARQDNPHNVTAAQLKVYLKTETDALLAAIRLLINNHINDKNNPHNVTPAQIGAYTKQQIDDMFKALENGILKQLTTHMNDKNNPHGVTPAQIGAYTKSQVDVLIAGVQKAIDDHAKRVDNPHKVTAAQLSVYTKAETDALLNTIRTSITNHINNKNNPHNVTAAQLSVYTIAQVDAIKKTLDANLDALKRHLFGSTTLGKLVEAVIPISTAAYNQLRWNTNGLYYGTAPDPSTGVVYVDAVNGTDASPTAGYGTQAKPFKTFRYALNQGPAGANRTIYLKESQTHVVNRADGMLNFRGGTINIYPYGPNTNAIPPLVGDSAIKARPESLDTCNCTLKLQGVGLSPTYDPNRIWVDCQIFQASLVSVVYFVAIKIVNDTTNTFQTAITGFDSAKWPSKYAFSSGTTRWSYDGESISVGFVNCSLNMGTKTHAASSRADFALFKTISIYARTLNVNFSYKTFTEARITGYNNVVAGSSGDTTTIAGAFDGGTALWNRCMGNTTVSMGRYWGVLTYLVPDGWANIYNKLPAIVNKWDSGDMEAPAVSTRKPTSTTVTNSRNRTITFRPPFDCKVLILRGYIYYNDVYTAGNTIATISFLGKSFQRSFRGHRTGGSGHGYNNSFYVSLDILVYATETTYNNTTAKVFPKNVDIPVVISSSGDAINTVYLDATFQSVI